MEFLPCGYSDDVGGVFLPDDHLVLVVQSAEGVPQVDQDVTLLPPSLVVPVPNVFSSLVAYLHKIFSALPLDPLMHLQQPIYGLY